MLGHCDGCDAGSAAITHSSLDPLTVPARCPSMYCAKPSFTALEFRIAPFVLSDTNACTSSWIKVWSMLGVSDRVSPPIGILMRPSSESYTPPDQTGA